MEDDGKRHWQRHTGKDTKTETLSPKGKVIKKRTATITGTSVYDRMIQREMDEAGEGDIGQLEYNELRRRRKLVRKCKDFAEFKKRGNEERKKLGLPPIIPSKQMNSSMSKTRKTLKDHVGFGGVGSFFNKRYTPVEFRKKVKQYFVDKDREYQKAMLIRGKYIEGEFDKTGNQRSMSFKIPFSFAGLANYLEISQDTLWKYATDEGHLDYHEVMEWAISKIEERLIECGSTEQFNSRFSEFMLKNLKSGTHQYSDKVDIRKRELRQTNIKVEIVGTSDNNKCRDALLSESNEEKKKLGIDIDKIQKLVEAEEVIDVDAEDVDEQQDPFGQYKEK